jgi:hypothetical protein
MSPSFQASGRRAALCLACVLAVSRDHMITTPAGRHRADALAAKLPSGTWQRISCGDGARGRHWYD